MRLRSLIFIFVLILCGLLWRSPLLHLPKFLSKNGGDALWAMVVYFGVVLMLPSLTVFRTAIAAFLISSAVEFSQLYHAPWIDRIRATRLGALVLGSIFHWPDLLAYLTGIFLAAVLHSKLHGARVR